MIVVENLHKIYDTGKVKTHALKGIDLSIQEGEFVSIIGKSGCGKSTLLNILGGMDRATKGHYEFEGMAVENLKGKKLAEFRNHAIGYVFQSFHLVHEMNIIDNVALPLGYRGLPAKERRALSKEALAQVGLGGMEKKRPGELSGGERQRVAIARALVGKPKLILADEPTGNLDEKNGEEILKLIKEIHEQGRTIIMVTHDLDLANEAERRITMADGLIVRDGNI